MHTRRANCHLGLPAVTGSSVELEQADPAPQVPRRPVHGFRGPVQLHPGRWHLWRPAGHYGGDHSTGEDRRPGPSQARAVRGRTALMAVPSRFFSDNMVIIACGPPRVDYTIGDVRRALARTGACLPSAIEINTGTRGSSGEPAEVSGTWTPSSGDFPPTD